MLIVIALSLAPISELRGAIPYGIARGFSPSVVFFLAVCGNLIVIPVLLYGFEGAERILCRCRWGDVVCRWVFSRTRRKGRWLERWGPLGLVLLVAIPLPGTGAWTGAVAARLFGLRPRTALPWIALGVLVAGILVLLASLGVVHLFGID